MSAVLAIHEMLIAEHGGPPGLINETGLESALASPRNLFASAQPDLFDLASRYASSIASNHPFHDGNKRVALTVAGVFLELNGIRLSASEADAVSAVLALTTEKLNEKGFATWLRLHSEKLETKRRTRTRRAAPRKRRRP